MRLGPKWNCFFHNANFSSIQLRCRIEARKCISHTHSTEGMKRDQRLNKFAWNNFHENENVPLHHSITKRSLCGPDVTSTQEKAALLSIPLKTGIALYYRSLGRYGTFFFSQPNAYFECIQLRCWIEARKSSFQHFSTKGRNFRWRLIPWRRLNIFYLLHLMPTLSSYVSDVDSKHEMLLLLQCKKARNTLSLQDSIRSNYNLERFTIVFYDSHYTTACDRAATHKYRLKNVYHFEITLEINIPQIYMVIRKRRFHHLYFQNYIVKNFICGITRHVRLGIVLLLISRNSSKQARVYHRAAGVSGEKLFTFSSNWQRY